MAADRKSTWSYCQLWGEIQGPTERWREFSGVDAYHAWHFQKALFFFLFVCLGQVVAVYIPLP